MDSGLAYASLQRSGMTLLTEVDTPAPRVPTQAGLELKWRMIAGDGYADRTRPVSLHRRQPEMTPAVWCRDPIVLPARISLPATPRGRANLPIRVHPRRRFSQQKTPAPCPRPRL